MFKSLKDDFEYSRLALVTAVIYLVLFAVIVKISCGDLTVFSVLFIISYIAWLYFIYKTKELMQKYNRRRSKQ